MTKDKAQMLLALQAKDELRGMTMRVLIDSIALLDVAYQAVAKPTPTPFHREVIEQRVSAARAMLRALKNTVESHA